LCSVAFENADTAFISSRMPGFNSNHTALCHLVSTHMHTLASQAQHAFGAQTLPLLTPAVCLATCHSTAESAWCQSTHTPTCRPMRAAAATACLWRLYPPAACCCPALPAAVAAAVLPGGWP
jgi:hypothetical protein